MNPRSAQKYSNLQSLGFLYCTYSSDSIEKITGQDFLHNLKLTEVRNFHSNKH
jgi:hypothetical protein